MDASIRCATSDLRNTNSSSNNAINTNTSHNNRSPHTPSDGSLYRRSPKQGGGRTSPNGGRRSPKSYYERTTTVRLVQPSTGKLMGTKLNHVVRTKCKVENGVCLCDSFLKGHCEHGSSCTLAHVPRQYLWEYLTPHVNRQCYTYEEGFSVRVYTPEMDVYYDIPSMYIFQTKGSEHYIELYNENGDNFKEKFHLCPTILSTGYCEVGFDCPDVHCTISDFSGFPCIRTHVANEETVKRYERLPANMQVRVFQPNCGGDGQTFSGDDVLRTVGATQYEDAFRRESGVPSVKMQHCAHFQNKKMCRLGDGCRFLHVVSLALATPAQEDVLSGRISPIEAAADSGNGSPPPNLPFPDRSGGGGAGENNAVRSINPPSRGVLNIAAMQAMNGMLGDAKAAPVGAAATAAMASLHTAAGIAGVEVQHGAAAHADEHVNRHRSPIRYNDPYRQEIA